MRRVKVALRHDDDAGFGLVEAIVALLIAGVVFSALAASLISAVQASLYGRQNQQATDFMTREVERMRSLDFGSLALAATPTGDARLVSCGATLCLPMDSGPAEPLLVESGGAVAHTLVLNDDETNSTEYTVTSYVTRALGEPTDQVRRVTVFVSWFNRGIERTRSLSTLVAYSQRGLPLPVFRLEAIDSPQSVNPGGEVTYELTVTNQGAPDRFELHLTGAGSGWQWFADSDGDGDLDSSDASLSDTTGDGRPDTGRMDPSTTFRFFIKTSFSASTSPGAHATTVWATSHGQPLAISGQKSVVITTNVVSGPVIPPPPTVTPTTPEVTCPASPVTLPGAAGGYTNRQFTLQHEGIGNSTLQPQMYLGSGTPDEPTLGRYSTNIAAVTGRVLEPVGSIHQDASAVLGSSTTTKYADWARQFAKNGSIRGSSVVRLWVDTSTGATSLKVVLYRTSGTALTSREFLTERFVTVPACAGWQEVFVALPPIGETSIGRNQWMGIRAVVAGGNTVRLAYDEATQFPASFTIASKGNF
jgi:hypothetical protein